jgi:hypothetical protein
VWRGAPLLSLSLSPVNSLDFSARAGSGAECRSSGMVADEEMVAAPQIWSTWTRIRLSWPKISFPGGCGKFLSLSLSLPISLPSLLFLSTISTMESKAQRQSSLPLSDRTTIPPSSLPWPMAHSSPP